LALFDDPIHVLRRDPVKSCDVEFARPGEFDDQLIPAAEDHIVPMKEEHVIGPVVTVDRDPHLEGDPDHGEQVEVEVMFVDTLERIVVPKHDATTVGAQHFEQEWR